jgi:hypothetical protein
MDMSQVIQAQQAAEAEKAMTLGQAMKHFHKGIMWSMLLSFALVMDGYDIVIVSRVSPNRLRIDKLQINSFWGLPAFLNRFGQIDASGERYISANWQAGLNNANNVGNVIGLAVSDSSISRLNGKPRLSLVDQRFLPVQVRLTQDLNWRHALYDRSHFYRCFCQGHAHALRWRVGVRHCLGQ